MAIGGGGDRPARTPPLGPSPPPAFGQPPSAAPPPRGHGRKARGCGRPLPARRPHSCPAGGSRAAPHLGGCAGAVKPREPFPRLQRSQPLQTPRVPAGLGAEAAKPGKKKGPGGGDSETVGRPLRGTRYSPPRSLVHVSSWGFTTNFHIFRSPLHRVAICYR